MNRVLFYIDISIRWGSTLPVPTSMCHKAKRPVSSTDATVFPFCSHCKCVMVCCLWKCSIRLMGTLRIGLSKLNRSPAIALNCDLLGGVGTDITTLCGETHNDSDACLYVKAEKWKLAGYLGNLSQNSALCCDVLFLFMLLGVRVSSTMIYEKKKRRKKGEQSIFCGLPFISLQTFGFIGTQAYGLVLAYQTWLDAFLKVSIS